MNKKKLGAVLLAAGSSSRYGGIKLLEEIGNIPMYRFMINNLEKLNLEYKAVVTQYEEIGKEARKRGFAAVKNDNPQLGISYSIQLGIKEIKNESNVDGILFSVCDQPFVTLKTLECMKEAFEHNKASLICAGNKGEWGNPCIIGKEYFPELMQLDKDTGGKQIFRKYLENVLVIEANEMELKDIDTREDAEEIKMLLKYYQK